MAIKKFETQDGIKLAADDDIVDSNGQSVLGGGGATDELVNGNNSLALDGSGNAVFQGAEPGDGVNRGLVWDYGASQNGVNSQIRQDNQGLTVRAFTDDSEGIYSAPVNIVTNQDSNQKTWTFDGDGGLTFPDGTTQTTAYTGQSGGVTVSKFVMVNEAGTVWGSNDGETWTGPYDTELNSLRRVAVGPNRIVYIADHPVDDEALYYTSNYDDPVTLVEDPEAATWSQVRYFEDIGRFVAVGSIDNIPAYKHSADGVTWTTVSLDNAWASTLNGGAGYGSSKRFQDIATNGTGFLLITNSTVLGSFYTTTLTANTEIGSSSWLNDGMDFNRVLYCANGIFTGWFAFGDGDTDADDGWWLNGQSDPREGSFDNEWGIQDISESFRSSVGYDPDWSELTIGLYGGTDTVMISTDDGQILYWPAVPDGPFVTIPKPYSRAITGITSASPAVITYENVNGVSHNNNEKIIITNCGSFNGTYYINSTRELFTDNLMTVPFDSSLLTYTSGGTITLSSGQYIDALDYVNGKFYAGNDDEEVFVSINGGATWTEVASLTGPSGEGESQGYMNDIDGYTSVGSNQLINGNNTFTLNADGSVTFPDGTEQITAYTGIPNTRRGFINLVGDRPNDEDDIFFESVVVRGNYAYVAGGDYYISNLGHGDYSPDEPKIYKFDITTGEQIWVKQITAGRGAVFNLSVGEGQIVIDSIATAGVGYTQGEEIPFQGWQISGGNAPANNFVIIADTVGIGGQILTASVKPGYDVGALNQLGLTVSTPYSGATSNEGLSIAYDDFNDKLVITAEFRSGIGDTEDSNWNWTNIYVMDPTSGAINQTLTLSSDSDVYAASVKTYNKAGGVAVVGEKFNEKRAFGTLTLLAGFNGYFDILKSDLDAEHYPGSNTVGDYYGDFYVTGTDIANREYVDNVNYYTQLPTTVLQGSNALFTVDGDGDGGYVIDAITNGGADYLPGHKIKILGSALGGTDSTHDAVITVGSINTGGVITAATITGTAFIGSGSPYTNVSGTNYQTGSGATFYTNYNSSTGITTFNIDANGIDYVVGDILTIAGTNFANGTSPTNDVEIEVTNVDGAGGVTAMEVLVDDIPTDALRIRVDGVDFSPSGGSWSLFQNLGGEAFLWTPTWSRAIGGAVSDRFYDVAWSGDGNSLYAVGRGRYETEYDQALVVKFNATTGSIIWSKDIKFTEAATANREARSVIELPNSTDILVAGAWYNSNSGVNELILTRMTSAGAAVWQKTYMVNYNGNNFYLNFEINLKAIEGGIVATFEHNTNDNDGMATLIINAANGTVIKHRVISSDGNDNRFYYNDPNANFADVYTDNDESYIVMAGYTYVPTDNYYNALLIKLPLDGVKDIAIGERLSIGEHILNRYNISVTTVTSAFDDFTATVHSDTITTILNNRGYVTRTPDGLLRVWTYTITDDTLGYLEFGDGSKQSFATNVIPQIPAANDYYLTPQDSGKHIFFEHENGWVYIPHRDLVQFPVGFTFTIVNTTGSDCYVRTNQGPDGELRARLKLAGRNIDTFRIGIPDSGSGSMVTFLKIKDGYYMDNGDGNSDYPDVWIVSGPGDVYDDD